MPDSAGHNKIIVDSVHGAVRLRELEWEVIGTQAFQRLRRIKQLGMGHLTYPNATHTRFSHCLGVFHVMSRILDTAEHNGVDISKEDKKALRLSALLHDVGHYPYSHLLEAVDSVVLTEEMIGKSNRINASSESYPKHTEVGRIITTQQNDLSAVLGPDLAKRVSDMFCGEETENPQLTKLISSSFDMDRLDYLLRDSAATGVPYGQIDLNYLLNNLQVSQQGFVGISHKALPAVEHMLFARLFMHRAVYYHKTTYGFEQACAQLLRRLRDEGAEGVPSDGAEVRDIVSSEKLFVFDDASVDRVIQQASDNKNPVIQALARTILTRRAPKLLHEVISIHPADDKNHNGTSFQKSCKYELESLAETAGIPVGQFLFCQTKSIRLEARSHKMSMEKADQVDEQSEETTYIFKPNQEEPSAIVDVASSLLHKYDEVMTICRLYVVPETPLDSVTEKKLKDEVRGWAETT